MCIISGMYVAFTRVAQLARVGDVDENHVRSNPEYTHSRFVKRGNL